MTFPTRHRVRRREQRDVAGAHGCNFLPVSHIGLLRTPVVTTIPRVLLAVDHPFVLRLRRLRQALFATRGRIGKTLPAISKIADRGLVWPAVGGALCLHGATRRAGVAGMSAVLASSAFTGVLQAVIDRDRPPRLTSLVTRGSFARPRSSSFPSTHTSNAFAFAFAATWVRPALGLPLIPFAAAIGAARIGIAHHYPSDVLAGAVIGAGFGTLFGALHGSRSARMGMVWCPTRGSECCGRWASTPGWLTS